MAASTDSTRKDADKPAPPRKEITLHGVKMKINPAMIKDVRVQAALVKSQDPNRLEDPETAALLLDMYERVFGRDQYGKLLAAIEAENDGVADIDEVSAAFAKALKAIAPNS